jgi:Flp pilus assembly CpaE family ATPase
VPGLRLVANTLEDVKELDAPPSKIVVALNRCETSLFGGIARSQHVQSILGDQTVITVRDDRSNATHAVNTGIPMAVGHARSKASKDIRALTSLVGELVPAVQR